MKAIIISDTDARALLHSLELRSLKSDNMLRDDPDRPPTLASVHRAFHYVVTKWLQEQGADCVG